MNNKIKSTGALFIDAKIPAIIRLPNGNSMSTHSAFIAIQKLILESAIVDPSKVIVLNNLDILIRSVE